MEHISNLFGWHSAVRLGSRSWTCGHCNLMVGGAAGFSQHQDSPEKHHRSIYICPHCHKPTYFQGANQVPGVAFGREVDHLPADVAGVYREARNCMSVSSFTAAVLACRKLLMHIAVAQGAAEGLQFAPYVEYLANHGFVPPNGRAWVDRIRLKGNEATHKIVLMDRHDAEDILTFAEMLLTFLFEFPGKLAAKS